MALVARSLKRTRFLVRLLITVLLGSFLAWAVASSDQLIHQVEKRYNGAQTLSVHFTETFTVQGHRRPAESGTLILRKQGKMRWDYSQPPGKLFVSDGKNVFLYTPGDNRVEKVALKSTEDMRAPLAFLLGHLDMNKEFRSFETTPGEGGTWLRASARNDRVPYQSVTMFIAPNGGIEKLSVDGRDGSVLSYAFSDEKLNPPVNNAMFHFAIPAGAEVVDSVDFAREEQ